MTPFASFNKEKLFIIADEEFNLVIAGYPELRAYISATGANVWVEVNPVIDVAKRIFIPVKKSTKAKQKKQPEEDLTISKDLEIEGIKTQSIGKFFELIPEDILDVVSDYPDSQWELIRAIKLIGNDFKSLMRTNPALAYIIVNMEKLNPSFLYYANIELLQRMIKEKRKEILRLSGFSESTRLVKIFSKINPQVLDKNVLLNFRNLLSPQSEKFERVIKILSFARKINKNLVNLISLHHLLLQVLPDKVIYELVEDTQYSEKVAILQHMNEDSRRWKTKFPDINTIHNLERIKQRFNEQINKIRERIDIFPEPPLKNSENIIALQTETQLISWAKRQQNCIRGYAKQIREGNVYFYKVIYKDEEATLEIKKNKNGLRLGDLLGTKNRKTSAELKLLVKDWFNN